MKCSHCGKENLDEALFCAECGQPLTESTDDKQRRGGKAPLVVLSIVIILLFVAFMVDVTIANRFRKSINAYQEKIETFESTGKYDAAYKEILESANSARKHMEFWKYDELNKQMSENYANVEKLNATIAGYRQSYLEISNDIDSGVYVLGDMENTLATKKTEMENALTNFDEEKCEEALKAYQIDYDKLLENNKKIEENCRNLIEDAQNKISGYSDFTNCESYLINTYVNDAKTILDSHNYVEINTAYNLVNDVLNRFQQNGIATYTLNNYVQADVSQGNTVKLYFDNAGSDNYPFKLENFVVYEQNGNVWDPCKAIDVSAIKGTMTIDIVADVSGSMDYEFYNMQNALSGFVDYTDTDTKLGLSTIGTIYERKQDFTLDKSAIRNDIWNLDCYGLTSLYQSLYSSVIYTASAEGARCVVAYTDGINEPYGTGYDYDAEDVIQVANYYQVPVYIIGLGSGVDSSALQNIARSTGGEYYSASSATSLQDLYTDIYTKQGKMYQLTYETARSNQQDRNVYVMYNDGTFSVHCEQMLNAEALYAAYELKEFESGNYLVYYKDDKYLSSDNLSHLGSDLEAVQTVINIYYAKNGFKFSDEKQLEKMISLGVVSANGTLDGDTVTSLIRQNPILWQNYSALYNYRYELIYSAASDYYFSNPGITYEELRKAVMDYYNEPNERRFNPVVEAAWNALLKG
jgi:Mg-chelatase subunit ChlD